MDFESPDDLLRKTKQNLPYMYKRIVPIVIIAVFVLIIVLVIMAIAYAQKIENTNSVEALGNVDGGNNSLPNELRAAQSIQDTAKAIFGVEGKNGKVNLIVGYLVQEFLIYQLEGEQPKRKFISSDAYDLNMKEIKPVVALQYVEYKKEDTE